MLKSPIQPHALIKERLDYSDISTLALRTPEARFAKLKDWDYPSSYTDKLNGFKGLRMHYVDVGKNNSRRTALCLHGQKTWSYAFRKTIPHLLDDSYRVIAPDLFGFGKSDKLIAGSPYSFEFHRESILALIDQLGLKNITVIGFDWGAWLGATLPLDLPREIQGLLLGNTMLSQNGFATWPGFHLWKSVQNAQSNPAIGETLHEANGLPEAAIFGYNAPFPSAEYKSAVRRFPNLMPIYKNDTLSIKTTKAVSYLKTDWSGKCVCVAGLKDNLFGQRTMSKLQSNVKNAARLIKVEKAGPLVFEQADAFMQKALGLLK